MDYRQFVVAGILIAALFTGFGNAYQCYVCNSEESEACATLESLPPLQNCIPVDGPCYAYVTESGYTVRSCSPPPSPVLTEPLVCYADLCNGIVYPENRRQCHQCFGADCADPSNINLSEPTPCRQYVDNDNCYDVHDSHGFIAYRGCVSDPPQSVGISYCQSHIYQCNICRLNGCNSAIATYPNPNFSCIQCNSTQDSNCLTLNAGTDNRTCSPVITEYGPDACYTQIEDGVVYRGCLFEREVIEDDCRNGRNCTLCTTDNCNVVKTLETCYNCHSDTNPNCINNLSQELRNECPLSLGLGCYLFDDGGEVIIRGCLSSLTTDEINDCRREDQFCKTCLGDDCNEKSTFQNCRACTSTNNLNCFGTDPTETIPTKLCQNYLDTCFLHVSNNTVTRGCFTEDANQAITSDCPTNQVGQNVRCQRCTGPDCNSEPVQAIDFCFDCDSELNPNCRNNLNESMRIQCPLAATILGCYTFNDGGDIVKRGCVSSLIVNEANLCQQSGQYCKTCIGDGCNSKIDFQSCLTCDSVTDPNCLSNLPDLPVRLCQNYLDECFTYLAPDLNVTRGCISESSNIISTSDCELNSNCELCSNGLCNTKLIESETCYECTSPVHGEACAWYPDDTMSKECGGLNFNDRKEGCYLYRPNEFDVRRGCVSELEENDPSMCRDQGPICKTCLGNDCNRKSIYQECHVCDSRTNYHCIEGVWPTDLPIENCRDYMDSCIAIAVEGGETVRGCTHELLQYDCDSESINCDICDGQYCNFVVHPVGRPRCHQCSTTDCIDLTFSSQTLQFCPIYNSSDLCYTYADVNGGLHRGCTSDLEPERLICDLFGSDCGKCQPTVRGCNDEPSHQPPTISCVQCSLDEECEWGFNSDRATPCIDPVIYPYKESCFTFHYPTGSVDRGCTSENRFTCDSDSSRCEQCTENGCNAIGIRTQECVTCRSDIAGQENCGNDEIGEAVYRQECLPSGLTYDQRGCYISNEGGVIQRGCFANLSLNNQTNCISDEYTRCFYCEGPGCNDGEPPSGAATLTSYTLLITAIFISIRLILA